LNAAVAGRDLLPAGRLGGIRADDPGPLRAVREPAQDEPDGLAERRGDLVLGQAGQAADERRRDEVEVPVDGLVELEVVERRLRLAWDL
jgi:hypothetical protein